MALTRARITQARQAAKTIAAAVPGLDASIIRLGIVAPEGEEDDQDLFKLIRAKTPTAWDVVACDLDLDALPVSGAIGTSETVLHLTAELNVDTPFYVRIDNEILLVQTGDNFSDAPVLRAQLGTAAAAHADVSVATILEVVTLTFDSDHSWKVGSVLAVSIADLDQNYAVMVLATSASSITFVNPQPGAASLVFAEGDLVFSLRLVIKAAIPRDFNVGEHRGDTAFDLLLYFGIEYASQTFIAIEDVAIALRDALALSSNWAGLNSGPDELQMEEPRIMRKDNPVPGYYKFTLSFKGA